jgi:hypothetical protein
MMQMQTTNKQGEDQPMTKVVASLLSRCASKTHLASQAVCLLMQLKLACTKVADFIHPQMPQPRWVLLITGCGG